jgi:hypothetical protein
MIQIRLRPYSKLVNKQTAPLVENWAGLGLVEIAPQFYIRKQLVDLYTRLFVQYPKTEK